MRRRGKVFQARGTCGCLEGRRSSRHSREEEVCVTQEISEEKSQQIPAESGRVALRIVILEKMGSWGLT